MKQIKAGSQLADFLSRAVAAIMVLLPFHALMTTWLGSNTGHLDLIRIWKEILIFLIAIPTAWLLFRSAPLRHWFWRSRLVWLINIYFLLQIGLGLLALHQHRVNATALIYALIINLRFLDFFLICYVLAFYSGFLKRYWRPILLWPAVVVIAFGLLQRVLPYDFLRHFGYGPRTIPAYQTVDSDLNYRRIQSTLRGANPLGAYLVLAIPALIFVRRRGVKIIALIAAAIALGYSYSRSAWLGTVSALVGLALFRVQASRRVKEITAGICGLILLVGFGLYAARTNQTLQDALFHTSSKSANVSSNARRLDAIRGGFEDISRQPAGRGPGTAGPASFRNDGHQPRIAENYYLQIGQETGIIGMFIFLAINLLVAMELWLRRQELLPQILLAGFVGISLVNLVSHAWADDTLSLLWWGLAGVALGSAIITTSTKPKNAKTQKKPA
jgi:hypothetical protein